MGRKSHDGSIYTYRHLTANEMKQWARCRSAKRIYICKKNPTVLRSSTIDVFQLGIARDNYIWSTNGTSRAGSGTDLSLVSRGHYRWAGTPFTFLQNRLESSWRSEMISSPYVTVTFSGDTNCAWWRGSRRLDGPSQYCFSRCSGTYVIHVFFNRNVCLFVRQSIKTLHPKWTHSVR